MTTADVHASKLRACLVLMSLVLLLALSKPLSFNWQVNAQSLDLSKSLVDRKCARGFCPPLHREEILHVAHAMGQRGVWWIRGIAHAAAEVGDWQSASLYFLTALEMQPGSAQIHREMASVLEKSGDIAGAIAHLSEAARSEPAATAAEDYYHLGMRLKQGERLDEALVCFDLARELLPKDVRIIRQQAYTLWEMGQRSDAIRVLEQSVAVVPNDSTLWADLCSDYRAEGLFDDALVACQSAIDLDGGLSASTSGLMAEIMAGQGHYSDAFAYLDYGFALSPDSPYLLQVQINIYVAMGKFDEAMEVYQVMLQVVKDPTYQDQIRRQMERLEQRMEAPAP